MSSHPKDVDEELIDTIINSDKITKHLHFPVQSGSNKILKEMNRKYTVEQYMKIVNYAREKKSDFAFSTDIIVGFPNETEEDFEATLNLIKKIKFDNIYTFIYSKRSGTKAALIEDKTPYEEKQKRINRLLKIQREISTENNSRFIGKTLTVLVDGPSKKNDNYYVGKNNEFIIVEFKSDNDLTGKFVEVKINEARNWAVLGELI
jgi:tRNA-2-methylthio-N6-dimethylallyladenosine synthase